MRTRTANNNAVENIIAYLKQVKLFSNGNNHSHIHSLSSIARDFNVSNTTGVVLKEAKIIMSLSCYDWTWLTTEPNRELALVVMDKLLHRVKKEVVTAIPGFSEIGCLLKEISDKITIGMSENNNRSQGLKRALNITHETNLFSKQEQRQRDRLYLAGKIASAIYRNLKVCEHEYEYVESKVFGIGNSRCRKCGKECSPFAEETGFETANIFIIKATDNLLEQLNK